jgi:hypothetical protein
VTQLRIIEGTPQDPAAPLCTGCKHAFTQRDSRGQVTSRCQLMGNWLRAKIVECNGFYPSNEPWLHEYESLAWLWSSGDKGEPAFVRLRDLEQGIAMAPAKLGFGR